MSISTIVSPSSSIRNFTVPWVAGCDGPMLRIWCSVWRSRSRSSASGGPPSSRLRGSVAIALVPRSDQRLAPLLRVVLAERVAFELVVEEDAPEIGMAGEADAVEIPDLA